MTHLLTDVWTWDTWFADDGDRCHAVCLRAPRANGDPVRRHAYVTVGGAGHRDHFCRGRR